MGDISYRSTLSVPAVLCAAMLIIGGVTSHAAGIDAIGLVPPYIAVSASVTLLCLLGFIFLHFAKLAVNLADNPVPIVLHAVRQRAPLLVLPALVFPLFLAGYTSSKTAIPHLVGFGWDRFWADVDKLIFGDDVWRLSHDLFGSVSMPVWEWLYVAGWGFLLVFATSLVALFLPRRQVAVFFTAMLGTWLLGGWLTAYSFSAAGPVFAHLFDPTLTERFAPLQAALAESLTEGSMRNTQAYLAGAVRSGVALEGAGISAMPSMHLGAASIYVLMARGTRWIVPALVFWIIIFTGSGHFGYHYWIDGIVAAVIAWLCWEAAEYYYSRSSAGRALEAQATPRPTFVT